MWQYFVNKSANNLHVVLGMSPVGDTLRTRCRNFPGAPELSLQIGFSPSAGHSQQSETGGGHWAEIRALQRRVRPALPLSRAAHSGQCPPTTRRCSQAQVHGPKRAPCSLAFEPFCQPRGRCNTWTSRAEVLSWGVISGPIPGPFVNAWRQFWLSHRVGGGVYY